jgi:hypothetical protein
MFTPYCIPTHDAWALVVVALLFGAGVGLIAGVLIRGLR